MRRWPLLVGAAVAGLTVVYYVVERTNSPGPGGTGSIPPAAAVAGEPRADGTAPPRQADDGTAGRVGKSADARTAALGDSDGADLERRVLEHVQQSVVEDVTQDASRQLALDEAALDLLTDSEKGLWRELLRQAATTDDVHVVSHLVDLVTGAADRYTDLMVDLTPEYDPNGGFRVAVYHLVGKALHAVENSQLYTAGNVNTALQRMRLLAWKYSLEQFREGALDIPRMDDEAGKRDYRLLQAMPTTSELDTFLKTALLYQAELPMTRNHTLVQPLTDLLKMQPAAKTRREGIDVARLKAWAWWQWANSTPLTVREELPLRGVYYQYTIDLYEFVGRFGFTAVMTDADREYFEDLVARAARGLSEVRQQCDALGVNLEEAMSHRGLVSRFYTYNGGY